MDSYRQGTEPLKGQNRDEALPVTEEPVDRIAELGEMLEHFGKFEEDYEQREAVYASVCREILVEVSVIGSFRMCDGDKLRIKAAIVRGVEEASHD